MFDGVKVGQLKKLQSRAEKLRVNGWTKFNLEGHAIAIDKDADALTQASKLDGCYVLNTDLSPTVASKDIVHDRYKDLALVEWAFRESKSAHVELRPVNVRLESRTRGHAFVVMMAYNVFHALAKHWHDLDLTIQEGLDQLATLLPDRNTFSQQTGVPPASHSKRQRPATF